MIDFLYFMIKGQLAHVILKNLYRAVFHRIFDVNNGYIFETENYYVLFLIPVYSSQLIANKN